VTWTAYSALATWGFFLYAWGGILPLLREEQGTSRTVMGLHSFAMSMGAVVAGLLTVRIVDRVRRRGAARLGLGLVAAGIVLLVVGGSPLVTLPAILVAGTGGSIMLNAANPSLSDHHGPTGATAITEGNALGSGVGIVAPLVVGTSVALGLTWRPAALLVLPLGLLTLWRVSRVPAGTPALDAPRAPHPDGVRAPLGRRFWLLTGALVVGVGIEFANTAWAADLLRLQTGLGAAAASGAVTAIVVGMTATRLLLGRLALRMSSRGLLLASLVVVLVGWLITWTTSSPVVALAGLVVTGAGIAGQYPLGVSLVYDAVGSQGDRATGIVSLGVGVLAAVVPFVLGALADATSTHTAFLVVPLLAVTVAALLLAAGRRPARLTA
jgi:fucose permease